MTQEEGALAELAAKLTGADRALFVNARTYPSGLYLGGPCKHLYALNVCRLTGELTDLGLRLRSFLTQPQPEGE